MLLAWFDVACVVHDHVFHTMTTMATTPLVTTACSPLFSDDDRYSLRNAVIGTPSAAGKGPDQPKVTAHPPLPTEAIIYYHHQMMTIFAG